MTFYQSVRRYRQPNSEFRAARADRYSGGGTQTGGQPHFRRKTDEPVEIRSGSRGSENSAAFQLSETAYRCGPHQGQPGWIHAAGRSDQFAGFAERKFSDGAVVLGRSEDGRELHDCHTDAAVSDQFASGSGKYSRLQTGGNAASEQILAGVASISRGGEMGVVSHYDIEPVIDIYGAVDGRDLGGVARDIDSIIDRSTKGSAGRIAD